MGRQMKLLLQIFLLFVLASFSTSAAPKPTNKPIAKPTNKPIPLPTARPTKKPTFYPSSLPTSRPTGVPSSIPTPSPTVATPLPSASPTPEPTSAAGPDALNSSGVDSNGAAAISILVILSVIIGGCFCWGRVSSGLVNRDISHHRSDDDEENIHSLSGKGRGDDDL